MATLEELLSCRRELAKLVGYESFAHRALKGAMAKSPGDHILYKDVNKLVLFIFLWFVYTVYCSMDSDFVQGFKVFLFFP